MPIRLLQRFLQLESASGIAILMAAILSMVWVNSPLGVYHARWTDWSLFWINDGLMAVFFLIVGLELKREFIDGRLSSFSQIGLPLVAALGGMLVPALIYFLFNYHNTTALNGWATPVATDIAFALGVLSLFGRRIPRELRLFLLALAIFDDIGAIIIIALFYSDHLVAWFCLVAIALLYTLYWLNRLSVKSLWLYSLMGVCLWLALWKGGIHPTLAGVLLALFIPDRIYAAYSPLRLLERRLHPWVAFLIMPLFALANAGLSVQGWSWAIMGDSVVLGIIFGLFLGKQVGVFLFAWGLVQLKWAKLPPSLTWTMVYGMAIICGIGFTMSLFLGTLSFATARFYLMEVRLGVMLGSAVSAGIGSMVLLYAVAKNRSRVIE